MPRTLLFGALIAVVLTGSGFAFAADDLDSNNAENNESSALASRVSAVMEVVLENHIDPPTRQQMILEGTKTLYRVAKQAAPRGLSRQVSALATREQLAEYLDDLRSRFKGKPEHLESVLIDGMLAALPGRARMIAAAEVKVQGQLSANRYVGTGIALSMIGEEKRPAIPKVFYNGPAWKAGVKGGDLILEIDGQGTHNMPLKQVVDLLRGEEGSVVQVTVRQPSEEDARTLQITRGVAFIPTVEGYRELSAAKWQYVVDSAESVAYIRINRIGSSTLHELRQVEAQLEERGIRGIILDLRYGGGALHDTVMVADALIEKGTIGRVRSADRVQEYKANPGALFSGLPMAVLIDRAAQGDREFLTAALQDNRQAVVVGEPTLGRGFVNKTVPLPGREEQVFLATAIMHRGEGTPLLSLRRPSAPVARAVRAGTPPKHQPGGIVPDYAVAVTPDRRVSLLKAYAYTSPGLNKPEDDPLLDKAIEVLSSAPGTTS